jgi:hypothetical protein
MKKLISFHGKQEVKDKAIADMQEHKRLDNLTCLLTMMDLGQTLCKM